MVSWAYLCAPKYSILTCCPTVQAARLGQMRAHEAGVRAQQDARQHSGGAQQSEKSHFHLESRCFSRAEHSKRAPGGSCDSDALFGVPDGFFTGATPAKSNRNSHIPDTNCTAWRLVAFDFAVGANAVPNYAQR
eukprot:1677739-Rhodomonas_salina.3